MTRRRWHVEWVSDVPTNEFGDAELDLAKYAVEYRDTEAEARKLAEEKAPESYWGVATIRPFEEVSRHQVINDDDLEWWSEKGRFYAFVGESQEVV